MCDHSGVLVICVPGMHRTHPGSPSFFCIEHYKPARYMKLYLLATAGARICRPIGRRRREVEKERARRDHDMRRMLSVSSARISFCCTPSPFSRRINVDEEGTSVK